MTNIVGSMALRAVPLAVLLAAAGCEEPAPSAIAPPEAPAPVTRPAAAWEDAEGARFIAVDEEDAQLAGAIAQARRQAPAARRRWAEQEGAARAQWAIKWAAPTIDGGVEYVWVRPLSWSAHRIEGRLANPPRGELECGAGFGELVGFSAEELADWLDESAGAPRGGFTSGVLMERAAPAAPRGGG